jgi:phage terminase large subunit GpA-like protein
VSLHVGSLATRSSDGMANALAVMARALAEQIEPPARISPSEWARKYLIVPDGPRAGEPWDPKLTPYLVEPLDAMSADSPINHVGVRKSAQTGFTTLIIAALGFWIDTDPSRILLLQPTDGALSEFNSDKLQPAIDNSPRLRRKVRPQTSRSGTGSTTYSKRYPGGSLTLGIASSTADLRSKTVKRLARDEIDEYPDDVNGQGDPLMLSDARYRVFLASRDWKKIDISTPTILGSSKIDKIFRDGDQRYWRVTCPGCGGAFGFEWGPNFRFKAEAPHEAHYVAPCCGAIIEGYQKNAVLARGRWVATAPGAGKPATYHFDTLSSPMVPWDAVAAAYVEAGDDPLRQKAFWNLWLGLPYEVRGDAPDHVRLIERRESYPRGALPAGALFITAAADVQMRGIWYEIVAWGRGRKSWTIDTGYCDGDTSSPDSDAFKALTEATLGRTFQDAWGRGLGVDAMGVDSGYRSHVVYAYVRSHQRPHPDTGRDLVFALKGEDGWSRPAIGLPKLVDIDLGGRKVKQGCKLWSVGTWPLKGAFYADLRKEGLFSGRDNDPEGFCRFGTWLDENYFKQITAEYLADEMLRGRSRKVWKLRLGRDNHLLDCRIYNIAMAEHLGVTRMTADDWAVLEERRGAPAGDALALFAARPVKPRSDPSPTGAPAAPLAESDAPPAPATRAEPAAAQDGEGEWVPQVQDWLRRRD